MIGSLEALPERGRSRLWTKASRRCRGNLQARSAAGRGGGGRSAVGGTAELQKAKATDRFEFIIS
jgi:hypothetical protein